MKQTLIDVFREHAADRTERVAYRFSDGRQITSTFTFGSMDLAARAIAAGLQQRCRVGDRVLLLADDDADFVRAFFGCLYAGVIAVPLGLPPRERGVARIQAVAGNAMARLVLTDAVGSAATGEHGLGIPSIEIGSLLEEATASAFREVSLGPSEIAFLQYTSGSTGTPKGVIVSHGNLLANEKMIRRSCQHDDDSLFVGWLPLFHDMGLVGNILQPAFAGIPSVLMPPRAFIRRPLRWLELISQYRATTSGGPNFAYDTCVRRINDSQLEGLDLRSWRIAFNGAEPIRARTMRAFSKKFESSGFSHQAFYPVYGLAEATLMVAAPDAGAAPRVRRLASEALERGELPERASDPLDEGAYREVVACGRPREGLRVRIVDPETRARLADRQVGEIWVAGPSISRGYWCDTEASEASFGASTSDGEGPFLRTGDLGFVDDSLLYVTGRRKDVLIVNGMNHYPHDVEQTVATCDEAFVGRQAAALSVDQGGSDAVVVLQEVPRTWLRRHPEAERARVVADLKTTVRQAIQLHHGFSPRRVMFVPQGSLPITTSGKIQRSKCRELVACEQLEEIAVVSRVGASDARDTGAAPRGMQPNRSAQR